MLRDKNEKITELVVESMCTTSATSVELIGRQQRRRETTSVAARVRKPLFSIKNIMMERSILETPKNHFQD